MQMHVHTNAKYLQWSSNITNFRNNGFRFNEQYYLIAVSLLRTQIILII